MPARPPRRLYRSRSDRMLGGVCAGVGNYLGVDPTIVRLVTVALVLFTGFPLLAYLIALLVVPAEPGPPMPPPRRPTAPRAVDPVWGSLRAPWEQTPSEPATREQAPGERAPGERAPWDQPPTTDPAGPPAVPRSYSAGHPPADLRPGFPGPHPSG